MRWVFLLVVLCTVLGCSKGPGRNHKPQPVIAHTAANSDSIPAGDAKQSGTYTLTPESRFEVKTEKAGVLGGFAHSHVIRARTFVGVMTYDAQNPGNSKFEITVAAEGLEVLTAAKESDKSKIRQTMFTKVLKVKQFPDIAFVSRNVTGTENGVRIEGDLTLLDQTRPVSVDVILKEQGDKLSAQGTFSILQSDFGIKPYSAALGSIKVANKVTFDFEAIGTR